MREPQSSIVNGSAFEMFTGGIGAACAVAGLAGYRPVTMGAIATIALGLSLISQGGALAAGSHHVTTAAGERKEAIGIGTEVLAGFIGFALGVMALFGVVPLVLLPVATIVGGAALLFGAPAQPQMADTEPRSSLRYRVVRDSLRTTSSVMVMAGLGGVVLGILGLAMHGYVVLLALIALLAIALSLIVSGGIVTARFRRA
jgi:hypothetical protein